NFPVARDRTVILIMADQMRLSTRTRRVEMARGIRKHSSGQVLHSPLRDHRGGLPLTRFGIPLRLIYWTTGTTSARPGACCRASDVQTTIFDTHVWDRG